MAIRAGRGLPVRRAWRFSAVVVVALAGLAALGLAGGSSGGSGIASAAGSDAVAPTVQYDFDGTAADSSGNGNDATWTGTPDYAPGISGQAADVRLGLNFLTIPRNATTTPSGDMSVEFWYKETAESQDGPIFGNLNWASGSANPGMLIYNEDGTTGLSTLYGGIADSARTTNLFDSTCSWNDVAVVVSSASQTLTTYRNGVQVAQLSFAGDSKPLDSGLPFEIGTDGAEGTFTGAFPGSWASGLVDDFDYYDTAISGTQVTDDFNATKPSPDWTPTDCSGTFTPTVQYNFDGTTADSSGNGNDATWTGTPEYEPGISGQAADVRQGLNFLTIPRNGSTTPANGSMSVEFWYKETAESQDGAIFGNLDWHRSTDPGMLIYNQFGTTGLVTLYGGLSPGAGLFDTACGWNYVAVTIDASTQTMTTYRDGAEVAMVSTAGDPDSLDSGLPFRIGADGAEITLTGAFPDSWASGLVDDFSYYNNEVISAAQVRNDFRATEPSDASDVCFPPPAAGFVIPYDSVHAVPSRSAVDQPVAGLWAGSTPTAFTKVSGASWLHVSSSGEVTGTAPAQSQGQTASITVSGTDGTASDTITVEVPVLARGARPTITAASWNLDDAGTGFAAGQAKELAAIAGEGLDVVGLQGTDGTAAAELADALGWHSYQSSGDLGIVSAYPISDVTAPTAAAPAAGVTIDVDGTKVRVWVAHLDESGYGPALACGGSATTPAALVASERSSLRYRQALSVAARLRPDLSRAQQIPVVLLGDLASPSRLDWTAATAGSHCGVGPVAWPVPEVFTARGLRDAFRAANPNPVNDPGNTWSLTGDAPAGVPQDRVDYVDYAGHLRVISSEAYVTGWPSQVGPADNDWPSDHAAALAYFQLG